MDSDQLFEKLISESMDELPQEYIKNLNNVVITTAEYPDEYQRASSKIRPKSILFGLYEGVPLTRRGTGSVMAPPDKITLFKQALLSVSNNRQELKQNVKRTLWHEIAHYYGLDHSQIKALEDKH